MQSVKEERLVRMPSDSGDFLTVRCGDGKILYGGAQDRFSDKRYRELGCGTISMANMIFYLSACGRYGFFPKNNYSPSLGEFMEFADQLNRSVPPDVNGLLWMKIYKEITGDSVRYLPLFAYSKEYIFGRIINSLENDIPLMISVYDHKGYEILPCASGGVICPGTAEHPKAHYMTLTSVFISENCRRIIVSSWGRRYTFDFDDYFRRNRFILLHGIGNGIGSGIFEIIRNTDV